MKGGRWLRVWVLAACWAPLLIGDGTAQTPAARGRKVTRPIEVQSAASAKTGDSEADSARAGEIGPARPRRPSLPDSLLRDEQIWHVIGAVLAGSLDGPAEIDSVEVRHGGLFLRALHGTWYPDDERVELAGAVRIEDSLRTLEAARGFYLRDQGRLFLEEDVRGRGPEGRFLADRLRYDRTAERLYLSGLVRLFEEGRTLRADWLDYDLPDSFAVAGDRIHMRDETDSIDVYGQRLEYDRRRGCMLVLGDPERRPRLVRAAGGEAGLVVRADTLRFYPERREGEALGWVAIEYGTARGACDRARFEIARDRVLLTGMPVVQDRTGSMLGDSMAVALRGGTAERLRIWGHARSEYSPRQPAGERHFAVGDTLTAYLVDGAMRSVVLSGDAQALYLPGRADRARGVGLNWTAARRIRLIFGEEDVSRVQFEDEVGGRYILPFAGAPDSTHTVADALALAPTADDSLSRVAAPSDSAAGRAPAGRDTRAPLDPPGAGGYRPSILARIRERAAASELAPSDSLLARLPFNPRDEVRYYGDGLDFGVASEAIRIYGAGRVTYQGMELHAEEILFRAPDDLVIATGEPQLRDGESVVDGTRMTYRIDNRKGLILQGQSAFDPGYYRGERIKRVAAEALFVRDGQFTTCDADSPHYHFHASRMKIIPGEKVIARPVVLYLGHIPVLAIPYAVFPTRRGRQSGVLIPEIEFGFDTSRGRFLRNIGYYWAASPYSDALVWLDYYERDPRLTLNGRVRYKKRYLLSGQVEGSFTRQEDTAGGRRDRWLLRLRHDQTLGERFQLKISGHFQSDKDYADDRDFGASVDERLNRQLRSQLSLTKSWSGASLSILADRTEYLEDCEDGGSRISQLVPSVNFSVSSLPLGTRPDARGHGGRLPFLASTYLRGDFRFRSTYRKECATQSEANQAAGLSLSLSDKRRLLGVFNLTPSAAVDGAWAAQGDSGATNLLGASWRAGLSFGTTLYGTFFPRLGPWEALRHVVDLSASYSYRPELEHLRDFPSVGGISLGSSRSSAVSLRATQRFHFKWRRGEEVTKQDNLLTWDTSTSYDFLEKEKARESGREPQPWGDISHSFRLQPGGALSSNLSIRHDPEFWRDDYSLSLRTTARLRGGQTAGAREAPLADGASGLGGFGDPSGGTRSGPTDTGAAGSLTGPWHLSATHVLARTRSGPSLTERSSANFSLGLALTERWNLQYSLYYDLTEEEVTSQGFTLVRDLHCWEAILERRMSGGRSSYYFRISIRELPDIKYERRRN